MPDFPDFYQPERIGTLFYPDMPAVAAAAATANLAPAAGDGRRVHLLIVDMQVDFCHEQGALYVPGAKDDIRRLIEFIFRHSHQITDITCTLDSHLPFQIFHPPWWADAEGNHPQPLTLITADDVDSGRWRPLVKPQWSREYVHRLEAEAKKQLTIWPFHVLLGGPGNALDSELWQAVQWHSLARKSQPGWLSKGRVPQSEHYSAIQPEIPVPGHPQGKKLTAYLDTLRETDVVFVAGEAKSHCVLETLEDLVAEFDEEQLQKIYVLSDCTSSVVHPEIDFEAMALARFETFAAAGVNFVKSTDPLPFLEEPAGVADESPAPVAGLEQMARWNR